MKTSKTALFILLCAGMPSLLGTAAVAPVLDLIKEAFSAPEMVVNLVLTLPPLATAISGFFIGTLSDKIGRVKVLCTALAVFGLSGVSGFFLENIYAIIACRLVLGVSIAGLLPMVTALITEYYSEPLRSKYLGYMATANGIGTMILQTACGALASIGWRYSFLIYLLGLIILPFVIIKIREPEKVNNTTVTDDTVKPAKLTTYLLIYGSMVLIALLMYICAVNLSYYLGGFSSEISPLWTGLLLGLFGLCSAASGFIFWRFAKRFSHMEIFSIVFLIEAIGLFLIAATEYLLPIAIGLIFVGFGLGLAIPNGSAWIGKITPSNVLGKYVSGVTVSVFVGLFLTTFIGPAILSFVGEGNYALMYTIAGISGCCLALIWFITGNKLKNGRKER